MNMKKICREEIRDEDVIAASIEKLAEQIRLLEDRNRQLEATVATLATTVHALSQSVGSAPRQWVPLDTNNDTDITWTTGTYRGSGHGSSIGDFTYTLTDTVNHNHDAINFTQYSNFLTEYNDNNIHTHHLEDIIKNDKENIRK